MGAGSFDFEPETNTRDALFLGDCDDGSRELASLLGWQVELSELIMAGRRKSNQKGSVLKDLLSFKSKDKTWEFMVSWFTFHTSRKLNSVISFYQYFYPSCQKLSKSYFLVACWGRSLNPTPLEITNLSSETSILSAIADIHACTHPYWHGIFLNISKFSDASLLHPRDPIYTHQTSSVYPHLSTWSNMLMPRMVSVPATMTPSFPTGCTTIPWVPSGR